MMKAEGFIAQKIRFKGRLSAVAIAISFFVIIIAVAISGGFRHEIRKGVASITGDIRAQKMMVEEGGRIDGRCKIGADHPATQESEENE